MKDLRGGQLNKDLESRDKFYEKNPELNTYPPTERKGEDKETVINTFKKMMSPNFIKEITKKLSHPSDSWEERIQLFFENAGYPKEEVQVIKDWLCNTIIPSVIAEERDKVLDEINNSFCGEMHLIRQSAGKNQLKIISEIMHKFRLSINRSSSPKR